METILREGFAQMGLTVPENAPDLLRGYYEYLTERNQVMNLTAIEGEEDTARLHFLDCAALLRYVPLDGKRLLDVGSGAGFPGLVLKILAPTAQITLLDSLQKRVAFQQEVCDKLNLTDIRCVAGRVEEVADIRGRFDVVTSRAVARLNMLCEFCLPMAKVGGVFAALKGPTPEEELEEAAKAIRTLGGKLEKVEKYTVPGTDATHSVVIIRKVAPTPAKYPRRFAQIKKQPL